VIVSLLALCKTAGLGHNSFLHFPTACFFVLDLTHSMCFIYMVVFCWVGRGTLDYARRCLMSFASGHLKVEASGFVMMRPDALL